MTGFTRILDVRKALRKINLANCQQVARGFNGEVYKVSEEEIVKLSLNVEKEDLLIDEINKACEAFVLGVPTMISFDQVEVSDGRKGIVMEALNFTTLAQHLKEHPEQLDDYIEPYVDLFRTTNAIIPQSDIFPSAKQDLLNRLLAPTRFLDDEMTAAIKSLVEAIPDGKNLVHSDGHLQNALLCGDESSRSLMLIDMGEIFVGHPIIEIMGWAFLMNSTDYSPAKFAAPMIFGLDNDILQKIFRKMMASYLNITDETMLDKAVAAGANVGMLRLICVDQVHSLAPEQQQLTFNMVKQVIERSQEILDSIALLTELIKRSN